MANANEKSPANTSGHTPGPWKQRWDDDEERAEIFSPKTGLIVANIYNPGQEWIEDHSENDEEMEEMCESVQANVDLITAAPDLLGVVQMYLQSSTPLQRAAAHKAAHAAVTKAHGNQH